MNSILDQLSKSNSPTILILVGGGLFIFFFREYINAVVKLRQLRVKNPRPKETVAEHRPGVPAPEPTAVVDSNFRLLERYYEQHIVEYKVISRATLVIAILGFIVIMIGVFFTLADKVSVGIITSLAGVVAEAASALFFRQNKVLIDQVQEYHKKLVSTQYLLTSISLAEKLPDAQRTRQTEQIIQNLLFLSNTLHGAPSDHLFLADGRTEPNQAIQRTAPRSDA